MVTDSKKVDVPLLWQDFVYALEIVSHKNDFQSTDSKNWFKVNPLDIFSLACEAIAKNEETFVLLGNVKVGMENITPIVFENFTMLEKTLRVMLELLDKEHLSSFFKKKMKVLIEQIFAATEMSPFREQYWVSIILHMFLQDKKESITGEWLGNILSSRPHSTEKVDKHVNIYNYMDCFDSFLEFLLTDLLAEYEPEIISKFNMKDLFEKHDPNGLEKTFHYGLIIIEILATYDDSSDVISNVISMLTGFLQIAEEYIVISDEVISRVFQLLIIVLLEEHESTLLLPQVSAVLQQFLNYVAKGFDVINGDLQCVLLRYGSSSYHSRYKKTLLNQSLYFIRNCLHAFFENHDINQKNVKIIEQVFCLQEVEDIVDSVIDMVLRKIESDQHVEDLLPNYRENECENVAKLAHLNVDNSKENFLEFRKQLIYQLLLLACKLVVNGENIEYTFANILPQVFCHSYVPPVPSKYINIVQKIYHQNNMKTTFPWVVDKKTFAIPLLKFANDAFEKESIHPFQICGVLVPKLVKNLNCTSLQDEEKLVILLDVIDLCHENLTSTSSCITNLLSHGIDLVLLLIPTNSNLEETKSKMLELYMSTCKLSSTSLLFLKSCCEFFLKNFPAERVEVKHFMKYLLKKKSRDDIRVAHQLCKAWWTDEKYKCFRKFLYQYADGKLKSRYLYSFVEILTLNHSIQEKYKGMSENCIELNEFGDNLLKDVLNHLEENNFTLAYQKHVQERLECFILYEILSPTLFQTFLDGNCKYEELEKSIPKILFENDNQMRCLAVIAKRMNGMQTPRYDHLKLFLTNLIGMYMKLFIDDEFLHVPDALNIFHQDILKLPNNQTKIESLVSLGYSEKVWYEEIIVSVETSGSFNFEENLRQTLLALFAEYVRLLDSLLLTHVKIDSNNIPSDEIFSDELSLVELKSRRIAVVKTIDEHASKQQSILEKKYELLLREEKIEQDVEELAKQPTKKKKFTAKLNTNFFDCAMCCGPHIVGCYSPNNGDHCERPLEIGFRSDSAFASIYDENQTEIENCELLFTDQGVFVYKCYTNGHPYDTSEVWLMFFVELLEQKELVPAIILPHYHPNRKTWELIHQFVTPELNGTIITCSFDYSNDWRSYYDFRPESFGHGKDLYLLKGFREKTRKTSFTFNRQISVNNAVDLSSMMFDMFVQKLVNDEKLKQFRFLGKAFLKTIDKYINTGVLDPEIISEMFHYERWKKSSGLNTAKQAIVSELVQTILQSLDNFVFELDIDSFFSQHNRQCLKLREYLTKRRKNDPTGNKKLTDVKSNMDSLVKRHLKLFEISELDMAFQETLMRWVFENEDRTWRYRGGRDGHETYSQFLGFLKPNKEQGLCFPGVICCSDIHERITHPSLVQLSSVVAYSIGEYLFPSDDIEHVEDEVQNRSSGQNDTTYEIVTAWVDPRYRGLSVATDMYMNTFKSVRSKYILFDMLGGSINSVIRNNLLFWGLERANILNKLVANRSPSYEVVTLQGKEQFEKILVRREPVVFIMALYDILKKHFLLLFSLLVLLVAFNVYIVSYIL